MVITNKNQLSVADIRPENVMQGQKEAMQKDIDWLADRRDSFVDVSCPACSSDNSRLVYEKYGMPQRVCAECETQFVSPRPDVGTLAEFYAQSANYEYWAKHVFAKSKEARRKSLFRPRAKAVADLANKAGLNAPVLLEVGAGYGLFCDEAQKTGRFARVIGIEPTPDLARICRDQGVEIIEAPYETAVVGRSVDIVASFEVIEHLFRPAHFIRWCFDALRPNGYIFLTCPNIHGFETLFLGEKSETVDHEHLNLFNPESLAHLLRRCGFGDIHIKTPGELDVEIVTTAIKQGKIDRKSVV